ncbi:hypothetical protein VSR01_13365 [Actinacidiphila sp. DG2A-62]|uniref:hypothetical protein n=1 Tax=Actinacidiphila sp. DG2A-62 TaxID=3108821 RepID=UPI002DB87DDA|nr:hypothetical protein [Actinacidiphila sp. DG2A-62]MEC3994465.1 hypothetical protein [Actinacidiphila sp. DG2A-62]
MATDAWQRTRDGVVAIWRGVHPERAESVADELAQTREELLAARSSDDQQTEIELQVEWRGRIRRLLLADPNSAEELRALLNDVSRQHSAGSNPVHMEAHATGHSRVYQAARDQHIQES